MKLNKFMKKALGIAVSALMVSSFALTAGAWNENPADAETEATTAAPETTAEETSAETTTSEETTTTTPEPEAVLDDEIEEDPEETSEEPIETEAPEETTVPETAAPETTAAATTAAAANTVAPDSYNAVEPFEMYVPEVLNVRGGPGTNYDKLGQVYANNVIRIIGTSGDWYVFDYYGADGYLLAELLTEVPETSATTSAPPAAEDTPAPEDTDSGDDDIAFEDTETVPLETEETTKAPETDEAPSEEDEDDDVAAAPVTEDNNKSSIPPVLLALICALAAFLLIGVVPVLVHKAHHKKLYQY